MRVMDAPRPEQPLPEDPSGIEEPHDVLAAEEFGIGTRDERHPPDPTGIQAPHDVLAAEEFAMPAGAEPHDEGGASLRAWVPLLALAVLAAFVILRRRR
jgi:hypothetical protein